MYIYIHILLLIIIVIIVIIIIIINNIILKSYRPHILSQYKEKHWQFESAIHSTCLWPYKAVLINIKFYMFCIVLSLYIVLNTNII